jgi:hypothetical protein
MQIMRSLLIIGLFAVAGCARLAVGQGTASGLAGVSVADPGKDASAAMTACAVLPNLEKVAGMAELANAADARFYAPLTGKEPELQAKGPVWLVTFKGDVALPTRSAGGTITATDPTCMVVDGAPVWFLTGPWVDGSGQRTEPLDAAPPTLQLPALLR